MAEGYQQQRELLADLEFRHDDLLHRLDALEKRVQEVLAEYIRPRAADQPAGDDNARRAA